MAGGACSGPPASAINDAAENQCSDQGCSSQHDSNQRGSNQHGSDENALGNNLVVNGDRMNSFSKGQGSSTVARELSRKEFRSGTRLEFRRLPMPKAWAAFATVRARSFFGTIAWPFTPCFAAPIASSMRAFAIACCFSMAIARVGFRLIVSPRRPFTGPLSAIIVLGWLLVAAGSQADEPSSVAYRGKDVGQWLSMLEDEQAGEARRRAAYALGQIGPAAADAVPALTAALESRSLELRHFAVDALGRIGPAASASVPKIIEGLESTVNDQTFYRNAAIALGRIGPGAKSAETTLQKAMQSEDPVLRVKAATALWQIAQSETAVSTLLDIIQSDHVAAACDAVVALHEIGVESERQIGPLVRALQHPSADVRRSAAQVLSSLGSSVIEPTTRILQDEATVDPRPALHVIGSALADVRRRTLYKRGLSRNEFAAAARPITKSTAPAVVALLSHQDEQVRSAAVGALSQMGLLAVPYLLQALQSDNAAMRKAAATGLLHVEQTLPDAELKSDGLAMLKAGCAPPLTELMQSSDRELRAAAFRAFAEYSLVEFAGDVAAILRDGLKDQDVSVRRHASKALRQLQEIQ